MMLPYGSDIPSGDDIIPIRGATSKTDLYRKTLDR